MSFSEPIILGRTGLKTGRMGIASGFGAKARDYEEAFEKGCNYFTWGTFILGHSGEMQKAMKNIIKSGKRDKLVLSIFSYSHMAFLTKYYMPKEIRSLGIDYADVLMLGYFSGKPPARLVEGALKLKEKSIVRNIGISTHNRKMVAELAKEGIFDVYHFRYNAAHRGAEKEIFPHIGSINRPGLVSFTATRWGSLLNPKKMPEGEPPATAADCYRFVLSNPAIDVCMMGAKNSAQMRENLKILEMGPLSEQEMARLRKIGDHIHDKM